MKIKIDKGELSLNVSELLSQLDLEEKKSLITNLAMDLEVRDELVGQLCGDVDSYWGDDKNRRLKILSSLEDYLISEYKWSFIYEVKDFIQAKYTHEHIYWKMFHDPDYGEFFRRYFAMNGIESQYKKDVPWIEGLKNMFRKTFEKLENKKTDNLKRREEKENGTS